MFKQCIGALAVGAVIAGRPLPHVTDVATYAATEHPGTRRQRIFARDGYYLAGYLTS